MTLTSFICEHGNPVRPGEPFTLDQCRICWLKAGGRPGEGVLPPSPSVRPRCVHLGVSVRPPVAPDAVREWFQCERGHGVVCPCGACKTCPDHEPDEAACFAAAGARHLAYHLLPVAGNGAWRRAIDQLRLRWGVFAGAEVSGSRGCRE